MCVYMKYVSMLSCRAVVFFLVSNINEILKLSGRRWPPRLGGTMYSDTLTTFATLVGWEYFVIILKGFSLGRYCPRDFCNT